MSAARDPVAVVDLGKTNSKLFVVSAEGAILSEARTRPVWRMADGFSVLDDAHLHGWILESLGEAAEAHGARRVIVSGHGCTFALTDGDDLAHPVLDYEQEPPADIAAEIDALAPPFAETFSPALPLGFNYGRHMLWLEAARPQAFARADAILSYPQFWSWRLSGEKVSEVSYLGCHSHLWAPLEHDYSSLVDTKGWRAKMPPLVPAGQEIGALEIGLPSGVSARIAVHNGVHDSNASLAFHRAQREGSFTLVSTGTWVIVFNPDCPLERLDERRDMLANVAVDGQPVPTIRFMGGREFDLASGGWQGPIGLDAVASVLSSGAMALPSFAPGGPMPGHAGRFDGPPVEGEVRAAAALLYVALMTDLSLDLIGSANPIVVDGGLARSDLFPALLAALRPGQPVLASANAEGSALGAARLVFDAIGVPATRDPGRRVAPAGLPGLADYRARWRALADAMGDPR